LNKLFSIPFHTEICCVFAIIIIIISSGRDRSFLHRIVPTSWVAPARLSSTFQPIRFPCTRVMLEEKEINFHKRALRVHEGEMCGEFLSQKRGKTPNHLANERTSHE
jgi:hypothetical protein